MLIYLNPETLALLSVCQEMSDTRLVNDAGITMSTLHNIATGKPCGAATAVKVAAALGVTVDELEQVEYNAWDAEDGYGYAILEVYEQRIYALEQPSPGKHRISRASLPDLQDKRYIGAIDMDYSMGKFVLDKLYAHLNQKGYAVQIPDSLTVDGLWPGIQMVVSELFISHVHQRSSGEAPSNNWNGEQAKRIRAMDALLQKHYVNARMSGQHKAHHS